MHPERKTSGARLGGLIRDHVETDAAESAHVQGRAAFVAHVQSRGDARRPERRWRRAAVVASILAAVTLLGIAAWYLALRPSSGSMSATSAPEITWTLDDELDSATELVEANDDVRTISFSDGTETRVAPGSAMQIEQVDAHGAALVVRRGHVELSVVPREHARWRVSAGPYVVHVTGTRFEVGWDPVSQRCEVALHSGRVEVEVPGRGDRVPLEPGTRMVGVADSETLTLEPLDRTAARPSPPETDDSTDGARAAGPPTTHASPRPELAVSAEPTGSDAAEVRARTESRALDWSDAVAAGQFERVVAAAEKRGLERVLRRASATDLVALSEATRYTRRRAIARRVLSALRDRFPDTDEAAMAAFFLGRIEGRAAAYDVAASWYATYLDEAPDGSLAREALGRQMTALHRAGQSDAARAAAHRYLDRFDDGPYADLARRIVARN